MALTLAGLLPTASGVTSATPISSTYTFSGTLPDLGCDWSLSDDLQSDTVDLQLSNAPDCASVHLRSGLSGTFDGEALDPEPKATHLPEGVNVTFNYLDSLAARALGQQVSSFPGSGNLRANFEVSTPLGEAVIDPPAVEADGEQLALQSAEYLAGFVLDQAEGVAVTQFDLFKPVEQLENAEQGFCSKFAGGGTVAPNAGSVATYANCSPPQCPQASDATNACQSVVGDTASLGGAGEAEEDDSQDQLCPGAPPQPAFLIVCVPTIVAGDFDAGSQSLVVLPGGALIASPLGGNLANLLAGPTLSSGTAIVSLGGVIGGDDLTLRAPVIELSAGVGELLGKLSLIGSNEVSIGSVDVAALSGLASELSSVIEPLSEWSAVASAAGINDSEVAELLSSASVAVPMEISAPSLRVVSPDFTLGAGSTLGTPEGGTSRLLIKETSVGGDPGGYFGATYGGYGGVPGRGAWTLWHNFSTRSPTFGNPFAPLVPGGGDPAQPGGGVIRIDAHHGSATIDGDIHADSTFEEQQGCPSSVDACSPSLPDTDFGLGSGGSVFITARTLAGNGTVSANGAGPVPTGNAAAGRDGAGGGGRIAVLYGDESGWSGTLEAYGGYDQLHGNSYNEVYADGTGGAGTVFTRQVTFTPKGTVSKGEGAFPDGTLTVDAGQDQWFPPPLYYAPPDATPLLTAWNDPKRRLVVTGDADVWATKLDYGEIDVTGHSTITTPPGQMFLDVTTQTLDIDATSEVTVDTRGYGWDGSGNDKGGSAPGATLSADGAGGSHGGRGGQAGSSDDNVPISGSTYDSASDPHLPGAGGSGGAGPDGTGADVDPGGGVLDVKVGTLELAGALSADGADNQGPTAVEPAIYINSASGAGAGGSILVHVATLSSTGTISADGGLACGTGGPPIEPKALSPGPCDPGPGGGGGGRVAVYAGAECSWSGSVTASGGVDQSASDQHTMPVTAGEAGSVVVTNGKGVC